MALKKQNQIQATFSMASMTDVIFLLLVFFMVTSTFVFPTAMEVNLPEGVEQTALKPSTRVYIDKEGAITVAYDRNEPQTVDEQQLAGYLQSSMAQDTTQQAVAIYADEEVAYGRIVDVLRVGAGIGVKMVLATKPATAPAAAATIPDAAPAAPAAAQTR